MKRTGRLVALALGGALLLAAGRADDDTGVRGESWEQVTAPSGRAAWRATLLENQAAPGRHLVVTSPARMDVWESWTTRDIEWVTGEAASDFVRIALYHGSVSPERYLFTIVQAAPNSGSYSWSVPRPPARATLDALFKVRVELVSDPRVAGHNDGHFRVACTENCTIVDSAQEFAASF